MNVILIMAQTADGKIARGSHELVDWTSKEDKRFFIEKTKEAGVMIMGSNTFRTIGKALPGRLSIVLTSRPDEAKGEPGTLEFTDKSPREILGDLERRGYKTAAVVGGASVNSAFLTEGLIDELYLTVEPRIFGEGMSVFKSAPENVRLKLLDTRQLSDEVVLLHYRVEK